MMSLECSNRNRNRVRACANRRSSVLSMNTASTAVTAPLMSRIGRRSPAEFVTAQTEDAFGGGVPLDDCAGSVVKHEALVEGRHDERLGSLGGVELNDQLHVADSAKLVFCEHCKLHQDASLVLVELPLRTVEDAQVPTRYPSRSRMT